MRDIIDSVSAQIEEIVKTIRAATARLARAEHVASCAEYLVEQVEKTGPFSTNTEGAFSLLRDSLEEWRKRASN